MSVVVVTGDNKKAISILFYFFFHQLFTSQIGRDLNIGSKTLQYVYRNFKNSSRCFSMQVSAKKKKIGTVYIYIYREYCNRATKPKKPQPSGSNSTQSTR